MIYWSKTVDNFVRCIRQKVRDIFAKTMEYIPKNFGIFWAKLWDTFGKNYGISWAKTIGYIMGYIWQKLWDTFIKNEINWAKAMGYNGLRL